MKTTVGLGLALFTFVLLGSMPATAEEAAQPQYIGVDGCSTCHKSEKKGDQLGQWQSTRHAQAYATLAGEQAKKIAAERGIADPQKADACLRCHVTAHGVDSTRIATPRGSKKGLVAEDGVGCETCHGAGSEYKSRKIMQDREASIAAGMIIPDETLCVTCHNSDSPTYKEFDFATFAAKIAHPNPEREAE